MNARDHLDAILSRLDAGAIAHDLPDVDDGLLQPTVVVRELERLGLQAWLGGPFERRLAALRRPADPTWVVGDLSGQPLQTFELPTWARDGIHLSHRSESISEATIDRAALDRMTHPRIVLVALYHPEIFPLPRFPLGISNLARAARATLSGTVELVDMQLGASLEDVRERIALAHPDILGVSATFGQYDILCSLLDSIATMVRRPRVVAGGSLTARTERLLLDRYPDIVVAQGAGEVTIADLIAEFHGGIRLHEVRGIGFKALLPTSTATSTGHGHTARPSSRAGVDLTPELDLLESTFRHHGVAQLESSRGCTNFCSFCPRGHKGSWAPGDQAQIKTALTGMRPVFNRHPETSRTMYLVDEEFVGQDVDAVERALAIATELSAAGFRWESSCRVDQIVDPSRGTNWHIERVAFWRSLKRLGLRRMLFGIESGVDSILDRFNKQTTVEQNVIAVRTLSALGIPTRFTYITFDHLMSIEELRQSWEFQSRTDLVLRPVPELSAQEIVDGVRNPAFVKAHAIGVPFYRTISYMLVSMECLIGAPYTREVAAAGLAGEARPSMGRLDASFRDWRVGAVSECAQLWVDRNFALDYTLKSLEKLIDGPIREQLHLTRVLLRDSSFCILSEFLDAVKRYPATDFAPASLRHELRHIMDSRWPVLQMAVTERRGPLLDALVEPRRTVLADELKRWSTASSWSLINAADPCGT